MAHAFGIYPAIIMFPEYEADLIGKGFENFRQDKFSRERAQRSQNDELGLLRPFGFELTDSSTLLVDYSEWLGSALRIREISWMRSSSGHGASARKTIS